MSDYIYKVGEEVWIITELPHRPRAEALRGEVTAVYDELTVENGYKRFRVKITDGRIKERTGHADGWYFDHEPPNSAVIYPRNAHTDDLIQRFEYLSEALSSERCTRRIREKVLKELFVAIYDGHAKEAAEAAFERGLTEGQRRKE